MKLRILRILIYVLFLLIILETGAEVRAYFRGYDTILFGRDIPNTNPISNETDEKKYGPSESFPFRSSIVPMEKYVGHICDH